MSFKLRPEVEDWFKHVFKTGPIQTKFDLYYLCLMMGLATGRSDSEKGAQEFVEYFVQEYRPVQRLIIGLFVIAEMAKLGLELTDRDEVRHIISENLDPTDPAHLNQKGFTKLNEYANGGFNVIVQSHGTAPHHIETFIQWYVREIRRLISENQHWASYNAA